jgi:hypothetical protein
VLFFMMATQLKALVKEPLHKQVLSLTLETQLRSYLETIKGPLGTRSKDQN